MIDANGHLAADEWEIHPEDVPAMLEHNPACVLLDCRTPQEFEADRLEGARLLPMQELSVRVDELDDLRDQPIIIYCRTGRRSRIVARYLVHRGFTHIRSMAGGIEAWNDRHTSG